MTTVLSDALQGALELLPMKVVGARWAGESLTCWGADWSFSTMSSWRLFQRGGQPCASLACSSSQAPDLAGPMLEGRCVDAITARDGTVVDISLVFSGGVVLEVFSDVDVEPWVLSLPDRTYVPSSITD